MRTVVTGAAGFIASHLCDRLLDDGHEVIGVDSFSDYYSRTTKERNLEHAIKSRNFVLCELDLVEDDLGDVLRGADIVYHIAGRCGIQPGRRSRLDHFLRDNVVATERLLEALAGNPISRFVYGSSFAVYGDAAWVPTKETCVPEPVSPYGITKLSAEHVVHYHRRIHGLPAVVLRYFTVYGPRQRPDMAIARFFGALASGEEAQVLAGGEQTRDFTYVSDVVEATVRAGTAAVDGMVINVGGGSRTTINQVLATLEDLTGEKVRRRSLPAMPGDQRHSAASINVARRHLGWEPRVSLQDGLLRQWAWLLESAGLGQQLPVAAAAHI